MLPADKKRRTVILANGEYAWAVKVAKAERRKFSNWVASLIREALIQHPMSRANRREWDT
jgi:hypothetical protein